MSRYLWLIHHPQNYRVKLFILIFSLIAIVCLKWLLRLLFGGYSSLLKMINIFNIAKYYYMEQGFLFIFLMGWWRKLYSKSCKCSSLDLLSGSFKPRYFFYFFLQMSLFRIAGGKYLSIHRLARVFVFQWLLPFFLRSQCIEFIFFF